MWILIIIIIAIVIILFFNYSSDKQNLHTTIAQKGGMDKIFMEFISCIEDDFKEHKILINSATELEILATTTDNKNFIFGIKQGFSGLVSYRCDTKRSNMLNADLLIEGNRSNQVVSYMMILDALREKYTFIINDVNAD